MDQQYFVRIRGRVKGPFGADYLRDLSKQGQFGRIHEVSKDGTSWERAGNFPELFATQDSIDPAARQGASASKTTAPDTIPVEPAARTAAPPQSRWYYALGGEQVGPVEFAHLKMLCTTGQLGLEDLVWTDGMPEWVPARQVAGLVHVATSGTATAAEHERALQAALDETLTETRNIMAETRPWVLFVAVMGFIYAGVWAIVGFVAFVQGIRSGAAYEVSYGLTTLILAVLWMYPASLLVTYSNRVGAFLYRRNPEMLKLALRAQKRFWAFVGTLLIAVLVFLVVLVVYLIALSGVA